MGKFMQLIISKLVPLFKALKNKVENGHNDSKIRLWFSVMVVTVPLSLAFILTLIAFNEVKAFDKANEELRVAVERKFHTDLAINLFSACLEDKVFCDTAIKLVNNYKLLNKAGLDGWLKNKEYRLITIMLMDQKNRLEYIFNSALVKPSLVTYSKYIPYSLYVAFFISLISLMYMGGVWHKKRKAAIKI